MTEPMQIVVATSNPNKVEEIRAVLGDLGVRVIGLGDLERRWLGPFEPPSEDGQSFEENATIKARAYAERTGLACLADDSGLEVDALGGVPGVRSSRYSLDPGVEERDDPLPRAERDRLNNEKLLRALEGMSLAERSARFVCVMALAVPAGVARGVRADDVPDGGAGSGRGGGSAGGAGPGAGGGAPGTPHVIATTRGAFEGVIGLPGERRTGGVPRGTNGFGYDPLLVLEDGRTAAELAPEEKNARSHRGQAARRMAEHLEMVLSGL